ncbi:hypothetical protein K438DRAFT_565917 [Mycena galopus ATCC 62051]|nr:hypothetical protein K438DRAFT_565917 [Mycena galopus ATCC 62051]
MSRMRLLSRRPAQRDSSAYTPSLARLSIELEGGASAANCWVTAARPRITLTSLRSRAYRLHLSWRDEAHTDKRPSTTKVALSVRLRLPNQAVGTVKSMSASLQCRCCGQTCRPCCHDRYHSHLRPRRPHRLRPCAVLSWSTCPSGKAASSSAWASSSASQASLPGSQLLSSATPASAAPPSSPGSPLAWPVVLSPFTYH